MKVNNELNELRRSNEQQIKEYKDAAEVKNNALLHEVEQAVEQLRLERDSLDRTFAVDKCQEDERYNTEKQKIDSALTVFRLQLRAGVDEADAALVKAQHGQQARTQEHEQALKALSNE